MSNIPNIHTISDSYSRDVKISLAIKNISILTTAKSRANNKGQIVIQSMIEEQRGLLESFKNEALQESGFTIQGKKIIPPKQ